jgi:hypothetical protein
MLLINIYTTEESHYISLANVKISPIVCSYESGKNYILFHSTHVTQHVFHLQTDCELGAGRSWPINLREFMAIEHRPGTKLA